MFCQFYCLVQILMENWICVKLIPLKVFFVSIYEVLDSYWIVNLFLFKKKDYLKRVESFINFILFNPKNISYNEIRCLCTKSKNKKFVWEFTSIVLFTFSCTRLCCLYNRRDFVTLTRVRLFSFQKKNIFFNMSLSVWFSRNWALIFLFSL